MSNIYLSYDACTYEWIVYTYITCADPNKRSFEQCKDQFPWYGLGIRWNHIQYKLIQNVMSNDT